MLVMTYKFNPYRVGNSLTLTFFMIIPTYGILLKNISTKLPYNDLFFNLNEKYTYVHTNRTT